MLERVIQHESGTFKPCGKCGAEPRHIVTRGRSSSEPVQFSPAGERHAVRCTTRHCCASTALHPSFAEAAAEWADLPQLALPLRSRRHAHQVAA